MRLLLILALTASRLSAQETSLFGKKPSAVTAPEPAPDADLSRTVAHPVEGHRPKA